MIDVANYLQACSSAVLVVRTAHKHDTSHAGVTVTRPCHCIMTRNRNMQTRWYTIGSADYLFLQCANSCAHSCVHFSFGCHVHSLSFTSYLGTTSQCLAMYDVCFLVSRFCLVMLLIICNVHVYTLWQLVREVLRCSCLSKRRLSRNRFKFQVFVPCSRINHLHQRRNKNGCWIGKRIFSVRQSLHTTTGAGARVLPCILKEFNSPRRLNFSFTIPYSGNRNIVHKPNIQVSNRVFLRKQCNDEPAQPKR